MIQWRQLLLAPAFLLSSGMGVGNEVLCSGYLPENDMKIPVTVFQVGGISHDEFNQVLDKAEAFYAPIIGNQGARLLINRDWDNPSVNASATRSGNTYKVNMFGGLARHQVMTKDGFMLVACHEIGHHLGGAPKIRGFRGEWASNEGQADYFATLRCMRFLLKQEDNAKWIADNSVDPVLKLKCEETYSVQEDEYLCMRLGMAGFTGASLFHVMHEETVPLRFDTPDPRQVSRTFDGHPDTQCRLDTYYQGSVCLHDTDQSLNDSNPNQGTCNATNGQREGHRPRCWFRP